MQYDFVYIDALGTYYGMSGDRRVLPALEKAARYHFDFTYPDSRSVETIDGAIPIMTFVEPATWASPSRPSAAPTWRQWSLHPGSTPT